MRLTTHISCHLRVTCSSVQIRDFLSIENDAIRHPSVVLAVYDSTGSAIRSVDTAPTKHHARS